MRGLSLVALLAMACAPQTNVTVEAPGEKEKPIEVQVTYLEPKELSGDTIETYANNCEFSAGYAKYITEFEDYPMALVESYTNVFIQGKTRDDNCAVSYAPSRTQLMVDSHYNFESGELTKEQLREAVVPHATLIGTSALLCEYSDAQDIIQDLSSYHGPQFRCNDEVTQCTLQNEYKGVVRCDLTHEDKHTPITQ